MTKDDDDALRCAEKLESWYGPASAEARHLRRLVAENEANERNLEQLTDELSGCVKLLRQAVEALESGYWKQKAIAAINQHLEGKA